MYGSQWQTELRNIVNLMVFRWIIVAESGSGRVVRVR